MTKDQQTARAELALHLGDLIDPRYAPNPTKAEQLLKEAVRKCWAYRKDFPEWVRKYINHWSDEAKPDSAAGSSHHDLAGVRGDAERGGVAR